MREFGLVSGFFAVLLNSMSLTYAGRPMHIDDADPVGPGECQIESGINYIKESNCRHWDYPFGLNYGVMPRVELSCGFGGQFEESTEDVAHLHHQTGLCDFVAGPKVCIIDGNEWMPRQSIAAVVKVPVADKEKGLGNGETDYDLMWIVSKALTSRMGIHLNVGYSWIGEGTVEDAGDLLHYGICMDCQLSDQWQLVAEVFFEKELISGTETLMQCSSGVRWEVREDIVFDVAAGTKLHGEAPDAIATAGLTLVFGGE